MTRSPSLPPGFAVRLSGRTRVLDGGLTLAGGAPTRVLHLKPAAIGILVDREIVVSDRASALLADRLLEIGMADPILERLPPAQAGAITYVVPIRDRQSELARLLASMPSGSRVIVVDDASADPAATHAVATHYGAELVRLSVNVGSGAARNAGLARVDTDLVGFVDSDVVLPARGLEQLARHFADPRVALVAPRVVGLPDPSATWIMRYEGARGSLDLGRRSGRVHPGTFLAWVPSTVMLGRVDALGAGFDPDLRAGEDVDLVWRLVADGFRVRYEPTVSVGHELRAGVLAWARRKTFYGTGAAPLARRHPRSVAPAILAPWSVVLLASLLAQRRWSVPAGILSIMVAIARTSKRVQPTRHPVWLAAGFTAEGTAGAIAQLSGLLLRHWWPLTILLAFRSRRWRRALIAAAVADSAIEYVRLQPPLDPVRFAVARRLDDLAYGLGVWWSCLREWSIRALVPEVRSGSGSQLR